MANIIITGGSGRLGKTVTDSLLEQGYRLHLAVRGKPDENTKDTFFYQADLSDPLQAAAVVDKALTVGQKIDAGVFLTGGFAAGDLMETTMDDINRMVMFNMGTVFNITKGLLGHFRNSGGGKLIFMGAKMAMDPAMSVKNAAYSLSKEMLYNFVSMINESFRLEQISGHILLPGTIDSEESRKSMPSADYRLWTKPGIIADHIQAIIGGLETRTVIEL